MTAASRSLATALWRARFASGLLHHQMGHDPSSICAKQTYAMKTENFRFGSTCSVRPAPTYPEKGTTGPLVWRENVGFSQRRPWQVLNARTSG